MSNPVEKYLKESGRDILLIEKGKFLNKDDIQTLLELSIQKRDKCIWGDEYIKYDNIVQKLGYIDELITRRRGGGG